MRGVRNCILLFQKGLWDAWFFFRKYKKCNFNIFYLFSSPPKVQGYWKQNKKQLLHNIDQDKYIACKYEGQNYCITRPMDHLFIPVKFPVCLRFLSIQHLCCGGCGNISHRSHTRKHSYILKITERNTSMPCFTDF